MFVVLWVTKGAAPAVLPRSGHISLQTQNHPRALSLVQELATELAATRGALAAAQQGLAALLLRFGESTAGAAGEGELWRTLAEFSALFTTAQRLVQPRTASKQWFTFL